MGNKYDLQAIRVVPHLDAVEYCKSMGIMYMEGSAKTGLNINVMFHAIGSHLYLHSFKRTFDHLQVNIRREDRDREKCC